jgi:hypothetical protein
MTAETPTATATISFLSVIWIDSLIRLIIINIISWFTNKSVLFLLFVEYGSIGLGGFADWAFGYLLEPFHYALFVVQVFAA